jgi:hypothetical protein
MRAGWDTVLGPLMPGSPKGVLTAVKGNAVGEKKVR